MLLYLFRSNLESNEVKNRKEISKLKKSGIIHKYNPIDFYAKNICENIKNVDNMVTVLCHIERLYNVKLTDIGFSGKTKLNHPKKSPADINLMKEIINSGLYICLSKELETRSYTSMFTNQPNVKYFYSGVKQYLDNQLLQDKNYNTLETPFNRMYVKLASHCLRCTSIPSNSCNNEFIPTLTWYNFVFQMNETIKDILESNNSGTHYKEVTLSDKQIKKEIKEQPEKFKKANQASLKRYKQHEQERKEHFERMESMKAWRDAQMERYDKLCDRFGGALPYSAINIL